MANVETSLLNLFLFGRIDKSEEEPFARPSNEHPRHFRVGFPKQACSPRLGSAGSFGKTVNDTVG